MQTITITKGMAHRCAEALLKEHNAIPVDMEHDSILIVSHRSLYNWLCKLGQSAMIAQAHKPINPKNVDIF